MRSRHVIVGLACASLVGLSGATVAWGEPASPACGPENLLAGLKPAARSGVGGDAAPVTDGAAAPEGALWDGPAAVKLDGGGASLTYDLGTARSVSALFLQADANDSYKISGSTDGKPGTFRILAEVANVVDRGHGLRNRSVQIQPVTIRYLRVGDAEGDGAFSVSELAAYCVVPTPFPPVFRTVDAPMAMGPAAPGPSETAEHAERPRPPFGLLEL